MERSWNNPWQILGLVAALSAPLVAGCAGNATRDERVSVWIEPSPILRQQIEDEAARLPWTHGFERLEQIRWFASVGEPAYEVLLGLALDEREDVAAAALASLGATLDRRLVPSIRELPWPPHRAGSDLDLERARTLVRLGDWSVIPTLIDGLRDSRVYTRSLCAESLYEATHENHGFDPRAAEAERDRGIVRWEEWWQVRSGDGLLRR